MDASFQTSVRERAYYLWLAEGRPQGREEHHWSTAERDLKGEAPPAKRTPSRKAAAPAKKKAKPN